MIEAVELRQINKQLAELRSMLEESDIITREEALWLMKISRKAFTNYICTGKILVASTNAAGQKFFSRRQIKGLKK